MKIKKVLFPTDFSKCNVNLAPKIARFAKALDAKTVIYHVFSLMSPEKTRKSLFAFIEKPFKRMKVPYEINEDSGNPAKLICKKAEAFDLVIMPTKGMGQISAALAGDITYLLIRDIKQPLLIIR